MAGGGIVLGAEQIQLRLRFVHLRKADVHRGAQRALSQRGYLTKRNAAKIQSCSRHLQHRLRGQRSIIRLLHSEQDLRPGVRDILILRLVTQLGAFRQVGSPPEIGY